PLSLSLLSYIPPSTTLLYTLSLHDALPIYRAAIVLRRSLCPRPRRPTADRRRCGLCRSDRSAGPVLQIVPGRGNIAVPVDGVRLDRKSTRLNSSHVAISYAVFCLKKKTNTA